MMADETMTDGRLWEIESRIDTLSGFSISEPVESYELYSIGMDLLAEVYRLRAREAAAMAIVRAVADMYVADEVYDQPFYALMSHEHETDEQWHQRIVTQARALLVQE